MTMTDNDVVRRQSFTHDGPIEIDIALGAGRVDVALAETDEAAAETATTDAGVTDSAADDPTVIDADLSDTSTGADSSDTSTGDTSADAGEPVEAAVPVSAPDPATDITVEVRRATTVADEMGISGLLSWVNGQFGGQLGNFGGGDGDLVSRAIRETEIALHGRRLVVHAPKDGRLRSVALLISVRAPGGSSVRSNSGSAEVAVGGPAARVDVHTGSGRVSVEHASEPVDIRTGSGAVLVGAARGGLAARGGSSDVQARSVAGEVTVETGSGSVELGTVDAGGVHVRTGSGHIQVHDAIAGSLRLQAGSGMLTVGIHEGVDAEMDVSSGSGRVMNELPLSDEPPAGDRPVGLRITGRTGSGTVLLRRAGDYQV